MCILKSKKRLGCNSHACTYIETGNSKENTLPILNNVFLVNSRTVSHFTWNVCTDFTGDIVHLIESNMRWQH